MQVGQKIQFEVNSAKLLKASDEILDKVVAILKESPQVKHLEIQGYTSLEGTKKHNQKLSEDRAASVMKYLVDHGISKDMLSAKGFGSDNPIAPNDTEANREQNRRVVFNVTEQDLEPKK